jgi:hypothetical protein
MPFRQVMQVVEEKPGLKPEELRQRMLDIVDHFDAYLDGYPGGKAGRSKHAVMGPVAKVLDRLRHGRGDVEDTVGFALRTHEARSGGFIAPEALDHLKNGTEKLKDLLAAVPAGAVARTVERVDYSVYFRRREKSVSFWADMTQQFTAFVEEDPARRGRWKGRRPHPPYQSGDWFDRLDDGQKSDVTAFRTKIKTESLAVAEEAEAAELEQPEEK